MKIKLRATKDIKPKVVDMAAYYNRQMETLAVELALAGGQVLERDFSFTSEQIAEWMDATLTQAKQSRETMLSKIVEGIDNG